MNTLQGKQLFSYYFASHVSGVNSERKGFDHLRVYSIFHGGEFCDLNDRVHGISCQYSDKTSKQTDHTFLNTNRFS